MADNIITQARLKELFYFDEAGCILRYRVHRKPKFRPGDQVGWVGKDGYRRAIVDGKNYLLHRLIWLFHFGTMPEKMLDHIDGNTLNNSLRNLRECDAALNAQNKRRKKGNNPSNFLGVSRASKNRWQARISSKQGEEYLGCFASAEEAHAVYVKRKRELHEGNML